MIALGVLLVGLGATAVADVWQVLLNRVAGLPVANWRLVGRWVSGMRRGVFVLAQPKAAPPEPGELAIGWAFHYVVGLAYAAAYLTLAAALVEGRASLVLALGFGAATLVAPWFVMQPAMGVGVLAKRAPKRGVALLVSSTTHLAFGLGLYLAHVIALRFA